MAKTKREVKIEPETEENKPSPAASNGTNLKKYLIFAGLSALGLWAISKGNNNGKKISTETRKKTTATSETSGSAQATIQYGRGASDSLYRTLKSISSRTL